ncbi:MAG: ATP-binding domain-containing protein [Acidimicrobiales bacterium]
MAAEQAVIDRAYARLDQMRHQARAVAADVVGLGSGGTHQARFERDVRVEVTERRLAALREADAGLVFGRIDGQNGESLYIGRVAISDEDNEPLIVDWRAPAAEPFYRATPGQPLGLVRRRHFLLRGRTLTGIEDDLLAVGGGDDSMVLVGEAALLASLGRARTGRMADIVATIQRQQDEVIRAPLPGILVVQGGPGTGKTAVALHRAAYLLYTYRFPLERSGVLLIGPNRVFLRYIEQVLPALGEDAVTFATPATLLPPMRATGVESEVGARVKGDARMAAVLSRAVSQRQRPLARDATIPLGSHLLTLSPEATRETVDRVKRRRGTHNERRAVFERMVARHLLDDWRRRERLEDDEPLPEDMERRLRRQQAFVAAVERMWPVLTPEDLLNDLFGVNALLRLAVRKILSPEEWRVLERPRQQRLADVTWTEEDVALLDEAALHLGPVPARARPADVVEEDERALFERSLDAVGPLDDLMRADLLDHLARWTRDSQDDEGPDLATRTFGHLLVDEAQDLSPMQARMIGRRCPGGSMTIVGDLGQASREHAADRWDDVITHLPHRRPPRVAELTVNYRTPVEVMNLAARVLAAATPGLTPPRSVRATGEWPAVTQTSEEDLVETAARVAGSELAQLGDGRLAVIAPIDLVDRLRTELGVVDGGAAALEQPIGVYPVHGAKGLEFDGVVVVEPAAIVDERLHGLRALYVALSRTTRRLHIVHARLLPSPLAGIPANGQGAFEGMP